MTRPRPGWVIEDAAISAGATRICGVDEVGRGPLAGPVTAAAVILPRDLAPDITDAIDDSKRLTAKRRETLTAQIQAVAHWHIAHASVEEIDTINIRRAALLAMHRAITGLAGLAGAPDLVLVDGRDLPPDLNIPARAIIKGDAISLSIAAASILAKTARDRMMVDLAQHHPGYGWEKNAGYGTREHRQALQKLGVTPIHRRTFGTVHKILYQGQSTNR